MCPPGANQNGQLFPAHPSSQRVYTQVPKTSCQQSDGVKPAGWKCFLNARHIFNHFRPAGKRQSVPRPRASWNTVALSKQGEGAQLWSVMAQLPLPCFTHRGTRQRRTSQTPRQRSNEKTKIRAGINETETRKTIEKTGKSESWVFLRGKQNIQTFRLTKKKREMTQS